jgi:hypothetical protein
MIKANNMNPVFLFSDIIQLWFRQAWFSELHVPGCKERAGLCNASLQDAPCAPEIQVMHRM